MPFYCLWFDIVAVRAVSECNRLQHCKRFNEVCVRGIAHGSINIFYFKKTYLICFIQVLLKSIGYLNEINWHPKAGKEVKFGCVTVLVCVLNYGQVSLTVKL